MIMWIEDLSGSARPMPSRACRILALLWLNAAAARIVFAGGLAR
jgi:hypothetical protein